MVKCGYLIYGDEQMVLIWILIAAAVLMLAASAACFFLVFYSAPRKDPGDRIDIPDGEIYEVYREQMEAWVRQTRQLPQEDVSIRSFDGLTLRGKYYEYAPGAPIELMIHGYRGSSERDMSGGVQRAFRLGRSALIVDQRASGRSEGSVITFGIREHRDCLAWVDFMVNKFGPDVKIILTGISMGASTVLMASGEPLPENVIGVLADCGYTSAREIIHKILRQIHLPIPLVYPFIRLGGWIFGGFDLERASALEAVKRCEKPVIFYHGETDDFVPWEMSRDNHAACPTRKKLVIIPGAGHGLSFPVQQDRYVAELREFFGPEAGAD